MVSLSEQDVRRFIEVAHNSGLKIGEEARQAVEAARAPDFYIGFLTGIMCVVTICRNFISTLGEGIDQAAQSSAQDFAAENMIIDAVELITMRVAAPAAVAAELWLKTQRQSD